MDYLAGGQSSSSPKARKCKELGSEKTIRFNFSDFAYNMFKTMTVAEKTDFVKKYLSPELISVFESSEMIESVNAFIDNNLNLSETSRNSFFHRNTLLYRIDKVFRVTGFNVRNFDDAMSFKVLFIIYEKIIKGVRK